MTLREIAAGKVTFANIRELPRQRKAEQPKVEVVIERPEEDEEE